jgi:cytochrome d ubiquinol oxidase subunit I
VLIPTPFLANASGWIFTEMGRQPWMVAPNPTGDPNIHLTIAQGVSNNSVATVVTSLTVFTLIYGALAVVWFGLIYKYVRHGPDPAVETAADDAVTPDRDSDEPQQLSFAY